MRKFTEVENLSNTIPVGRFIKITLQCHGTVLHREVKVLSKESHSKYACSLFCVDQDNRGGYLWVRPKYELDNMIVVGWEELDNEL